VQAAGARTPRRSQSPLALLVRTAGRPAELLGKAGRFLALLARYADSRALDDKLERLVAGGFIDRAPTRVQLVAGSIDMLRFWIVPASDDYYERIGIDFRFHQILRLLDEPASLADPVGFFSTRDAIIGHLMQIVHANPQYDLELLGLWDDGLAELGAQIEAMLAGTHPRARAIGAIVEEPDYHARLLDYVRAYRKNPEAPPPLRENVAARDHFKAMERTFGSLRTAMRYFCRLPTDPAAALRHLATVRTFPMHLGEPAAAGS
jgi:hypothetical protein